MLQTLCMTAPSAAIVHVRRMVSCAHMKKQNLKQEELMQKRYAQESASEEQQKKNKVKVEIRSKEQIQQQREKMERMQHIQQQKRQKRELEQKRKWHRNEEHNKVNEADMDYLKEQVRNLKGISGGGGNYIASMPLEGIAVELSDNGVELSEVQLEQQAEIMGEAGMTGGNITSPGVTASTGIPVGAASGGIPADAGAALNVSI